MLVSFDRMDLGVHSVFTNKFVLNYEGEMTCLFVKYNRSHEIFDKNDSFDYNMCRKSKFFCKLTFDCMFIIMLFVIPLSLSHKDNMNVKNAHPYCPCNIFPMLRVDLCLASG